MSVINSANMNLPVPVVSNEPGPDYATDINNCMTTIDTHNHAAGKGVPITPSGLNISTDLSFQSNNATTLRAVRMNSQSAAITSSAPDINEIYVVNGDLYYNDNAGNQIRLTQSGSIVGTAGSITGLPSGTASASYSAGTFVFQSATNTSAVIDGGSVILRNNTASSKGLTLSPPNAMAANYSLVLPSLPASTKMVVCDTSGNLSATYDVDNASLQVTSNLLSIKPLGVLASMINDGAVTRPKLEAVGQTSTAVNPGANSSTTNVAIASVTLTTTGRPVMFLMQGNGNTDAAIQIVNTTPGSINTAYGSLYLQRDGASSTNLVQLGWVASTTVNTVSMNFAPSAINCMDQAPTAASHTWVLYSSVNNAAISINVIDCNLIAYEL